MKREHIYFGLVMVLLFLAPRLQTSMLFSNIPSKSSISFALFGLVLWALSRGPNILRFMGGLGLVPFFLFWFSAYALMSTLTTVSAVNILFASQYLLYAFLSAMLLAGYISKTMARDEVDRFVGVFVWVGVVYALGVIVSYWTGPIYPDQVLDYGRMWGGRYLMQGVGFGANPNAVGGVLIMFLAVTVLLYKAARRTRVLFTLLMLAAILLTISRAAIIGCLVGVVAMLLPFALQDMGRTKVSKRYLNVVVGVMIAAVALAVLLALMLVNNEEVMLSIMEGFGLGKYGLTEMETSRMSAWKHGISLWVESPPLKFLLGYGFKGSAVLGTEAIHTSHNFFISILGDFGLLGFFVFSVPYIVLFVQALLLSASGSRVGLAAVWCLASFLFMNFTESFFYGIEYVFLVTLLAMLVCVEKRRLALQGTESETE